MNSKEVTQAALSQFEFTSEILIPAPVVENMKVTAEFREAINSWAIQIHTYVWAETLSSDECMLETFIPINFWEHFKLQVFPEWLKMIWPVRYEENRKRITVEQVAIFPNLPLVLPPDSKDLGAYVVRTRVKDKVVQ